MMTLIQHDNKNHPLKGMKPITMQTAKIVLSEKERNQIQQLIDEEIAKTCRKTEINWDQIEKTFMYFKQTKEYDAIENRSLSEMMETLKETFVQSQNLMEKELTRCQKTEKALEVMYKMYFTKDAAFKDKMKELNS